MKSFVVMAALATVAVSLSGCTDPGPSATAGSDAVADASEPLSGDDLDANVTLPVDEPGAPRTLFLTADGGLADVAGEAGTVAAQSTYHECLGMGDCGVQEFLSPPLAVTAMVHPADVTYTIWLRSSAPVLSSQVFDLGAWFGSTRAVPAFAVVNYAAPIMPGAPVKMEFTFPFEAFRPIVVPAGESFRLWLVVGGFHDGNGVLQVLTGGDTASAVSFTGGNISFAPGLAALSEEKLTGRLAIPGLPFSNTPADGEGQTFRWHSFTLGADVSQLELRLAMTAAARNPSDIDMDLWFGSERLAGGHTPLERETIYLAGPALDGLQGQELRVRVSSFAAAQVTYDLVVAQG